jgi:hypothetical protein
MVRARPETRDKLRELSQRAGVTAVEMLDRLVQDHEDAQLLAWFDNPTPAVLADTQAEVAIWDGALHDGLDPAEDFSWVGTERADD